MENPFKKTIKPDDAEDSQAGDLTENEQTAEAETADKSDEITEDKDNNITSNDKNDKKSSSKTDEYKEKYETLNNQYIRLAADFDNYRKRQAQERESLLKYGAESTVKPLLEVMDNFDRGLAALDKIDDIEKAKECYNLAYKNFNNIMSKIGLSVIKTEGEIFDPNLHEAVMQTPTNDVPEHTIIAEMQKGYKLGDKVLRAALVNVAVPIE